MSRSQTPESQVPESQVPRSQVSGPNTHPAQSTDSDAHKGAIDSDKPEGRASSNPARPDQHGNLSGQLPHRKIDTGGADTDFPEPGSNPEHSGQK